MQVLIITVLAVFIITPLLYSLSRDLRGIGSFKDEIDRYEGLPETRSLTRRFLLGWEWKLQRNMHRSLINLLGDKFVTFFFHLAGYFFLLVIVFIWISLGLLIASTFAS